MNTHEVAQKIKAHLVKLAIDDKLPLDMNALDTYPIQEILKEAENDNAFGFDVGDVLQQAKKDRIKPKLTTEEAKEVLIWMRNKADVSIGVSWDTLSYFIGRVVENRK